MMEKIGKSLNQLQTLAIHIDEMEELINPTTKVRAAYELLIKNIYRWHVEDALALQVYFREVLKRRITEVIFDVEQMLLKYRNIIQLKYHWIFRIYNALQRTTQFMEDLYTVQQFAR